MDNTTRKLLKLLKLTPDQVYHVFCLGLCLICSDKKVSEREAEMLTRVGFGLGLQPQDIKTLIDNAEEAMRETSVADVVAYSVASLKKSLDAERLEGVYEILRFLAASDKAFPVEEQELLKTIREAWFGPGSADKA